MPCNDGGGPYFADYSEEYNAAKSRLDKATQVACELAKLLTHTQKQKLSSKARKWIETHRIMDDRRIAHEQRKLKEKELREKALRKLTPGERRLLGVSLDTEDDEE